MLPLLSLGLPYLINLVGGALGLIDHPSAATAVTALNDVTSAINSGAVPAPAVAAASTVSDTDLNKHIEAMRALDASQETTEQAAVNATMQVEEKSEDWFVRRARPFFLYMIGFTWLVQMVAVSYVACFVPTQAPMVVAAIAGMFPQWSIALSVVGVYVHVRSTEKRAANGDTSPSSAKQMWNAVVSQVKR